MEQKITSLSFWYPTKLLRGFVPFTENAFFSLYFSVGINVVLLLSKKNEKDKCFNWWNHKSNQLNDFVDSFGECSLVNKYIPCYSERHWKKALNKTGGCNASVVNPLVFLPIKHIFRFIPIKVHWPWTKLEIIMS